MENHNVPICLQFLTCCFGLNFQLVYMYYHLKDIQHIVESSCRRDLRLPLVMLKKASTINTYTARPVCWSGWISDSYCSLKPLCSGMGEVVPARTSLTLLPPSPRTVLSLSCFKVSQCINCRDWHCKS